MIYNVFDGTSKPCLVNHVNVDLYSALSWSHLWGAQVWHSFSRYLTVLPAHSHSSANGMNHICLCLPSRSWYSFTDPGGMDGWVGLGWLGGYIQNKRPAPVANLSTNLSRHRLPVTSLIEASMLTTTPNQSIDRSELFNFCFFDTPFLNCVDSCVIIKV